MKIRNIQPTSAERHAKAAASAVPRSVAQAYAEAMDEPEHFPMQPHVAAPPEPSEPEMPQSELAKWLREQTWSEFAQSLARSYSQYGRLTPRQLESARGMHAKVLERQATGEPVPAERRRDPEVGFYKVGEEIYKVQKNRAGTSSYAKRLVCEGGSSDWEYVGKSPFGSLTPENRMTMEEAAEWGQETGQCMVCSAVLTDPESIARGIGPICATRF